MRRKEAVLQHKPMDEGPLLMSWVTVDHINLDHLQSGMRSVLEEICIQVVHRHPHG